MKKILFILFLMLLGGQQYLAAQSIEVSFDGNTILPNGEVTWVGDTGTYISNHLIIENISGTDLDVKVRKREVELLLPITSNYFCWGTTCYSPSVFDSPHTVSLSPDDFDNSFIGYCYSSNIGTVVMDYTFYNEADPNDTTMVTVNYVFSGATGIMDRDDQVELNIYPNPVQNVFRVDAEMHGTAGSIQLYDAIGNMVRNYPMVTEAYDVQGLAKGAYMVVVLDQAGVRIGQKRIAIQ